MRDNPGGGELDPAEGVRSAMIDYGKSIGITCKIALCNDSRKFSK